MFQFSILQLMLLTVAVAIIATIGNHLRTFWGEDLQSTFRSSSTAALYGITNIITSIIVSAAISLLAMWVALSPRRPQLALLIAVIAAATIGLIYPFLFRISWTGFLRNSLYTVGLLLLTAGSLLVVRECGVRLVRHRRGPHRMTPAS